MIHCKELNKDFATKKDMFSALVENKDTLIAQKKAIKKEVDCGVIINPVIVKENKANKQVVENRNELKVVVIINTTNFLDSHGDVHIPGIWKKSLSENKMIMHLNSHDMEFDKIISDGDDLKAYTKNYTWAELGYAYEGVTEGLTFDSNIRKDRNEFMLNQYANGWVKNHSVGMYYVKMDFAINDEDYPNEYEAWNKYYPQIANKELAEEKGFFWYVLEAKVIEGSAVPIGSNSATPTISTENKNEPEQSTQTKIEPEQSTQKGIDYNYLLQNLKLT